MRNVKKFLGLYAYGMYQELFCVGHEICAQTAGKINLKIGGRGCAECKKIIGTVRVWYVSMVFYMQRKRCAYLSLSCIDFVAG